MNITVLVITILVSLALIILLVIRNQKDRKQLENQLNRDYRKTKDEEGDTPMEDFPK